MKLASFKNITYALLNFFSKSRISPIAIGAILTLGLLCAPADAHAATFSVSSNSNTYVVGTTFAATIVMNTAGENINAVQLGLVYPVDKLEVSSVISGESSLQIFATPPRVDNKKGRIDIIAGQPGGLNTNAAVVLKVNFKVKNAGSAFLRFTGDSKALLNDGSGTAATVNTATKYLKLELPAPQGPTIQITEQNTAGSQDHAWVNDPTAKVSWSLKPGQSADGYSYVVSRDATEVPDEIVDTQNPVVALTDLAQGYNYFIVRALSKGVWGGPSVKTILVDKTGPQPFSVEVLPSDKTFISEPYLRFSTIDEYSGMNRFEVSIAQRGHSPEAFVKAESPYAVSQLAVGKYTAVVRAYDNVGNVTEVKKDFEITDPESWFMRSAWQWFAKIITKVWPYLLIGILILVLVIILLVRRRHARGEDKHTHRHLK